MKRLLVIRFGALGDLIHVSPSLEAVKRAYPGVEIHLLTSPGYRVLANLLPGVDHVWTWEKKRGWLELFKIAVQLKRAGIDSVVNLHPSFKSLLIMGLLLPIRSTVYHKEKLKVKGSAQRAIHRHHATEDFYQPFQRLLGLPNLDHQFLPMLKHATSSENMPFKPHDQRWIAVIPGVGAKRSNRAWEPASYLHLAQALLTERPDISILLVGGPDEAALAGQLKKSLAGWADQIENHCGKHDIPGTASLLAQCDLVIGGDTGPMHLAAALGVPLVGIYGPTALSRTGPLAHGESCMLLPPDSLACWPCELSECPYTGDEHLACMKQITVAQAKQAVLSVLKA